jgi:hypothetical protein
MLWILNCNKFEGVVLLLGCTYYVVRYTCLHLSNAIY